MHLARTFAITVTAIVASDVDLDGRAAHLHAGGVTRSMKGGGWIGYRMPN